jgi:hypothetical protein
MGAAIVNAVGLAGCANSCFVFVSSNGNSGVFVKVADPPPACPLGQAKGAIRLTVIKSPVCETCTVSATVEHVLVTVRSVQLGPNAIDDTNSSEWLEIAPHLADEPRQIDLTGEPSTEVLVESGIVPAGNYTKVRLRFVRDSPGSRKGFSTGNACGEGQWNCVVRGDGNVEPLHLPGGAPELLIPLDPNNQGRLVLPDSRMELRIGLQPRRILSLANGGGLAIENVLEGRATGVRQWPPLRQTSP